MRRPSEARAVEAGARRGEGVAEKRERILDAAIACVRGAGFHAASMAEIAQAAGLSVGQIYRYFDNKEAIIAALVERRAADLRKTFASLDATPGDLLTAMVEGLPGNIDHALEADRIALDLEILAEAARNPAVGRIVRQAEAAHEAHALRVLSRLRKPGWTDEDLQIRSELLHILFEGLQTRSLRRGEIDRQAIARAFAQLFGEMLR